MAADRITGSTYWHDQPDGQVHEILWPYVEQLKRQNAPRLRELLRNHAMYGNGDVIGFQPYGYFRSSQSPFSNLSDPTLNICESLVDTAANRIVGATQVAIEYVTTDGDWNQQRQAKNRTRLVDAVFCEKGVYDLFEEVVTDAGIYGEGIAKIFERKNELVIERRFPAEVFVDPLEAQYGESQQIFEIKAVPRTSLLKQWGKKKGLRKLIEEAPAIQLMGLGSKNSMAPDMICVVEAYLLPSSRDAGDGVRAIILQNGTLQKSEWKKSYFPYAIFRWKRNRIGWYGRSIISSVARVQSEISQYMRVISRSHYVIAVPRIWAPPGSNFDPDHFTRDVGSVIESTVMPQIIAQQILPPEAYDHLERLVKYGYQLSGISEMQASAKKSPGITSAVGINAEVDLQSDRLANPQKRAEMWFVETARRAVDVAKEIYDSTGKFAIVAKGLVPGRSRAKVIELGDSMDLDEDATVMQPQPLAAMTRQIPGKLEYINTLLQMGTITRAQAARLYSNPDIDAMLDPQAAKEELLRKKIEDIYDLGWDGFDPPEPFDDLDLSMSLFVNAYNQAKLKQAPDDVLDALRQYIFQVKAFMAPPAPLPQLPGLPGSKGPEGVPPPGSMPGVPPPGAAPMMQ